MENKNQKKSFLKRLFSKKAAASVGTAVKVLTSVVLGVAMLAGTYGIVKTGVIPTTEAKVSSMFGIKDNISVDGGNLSPTVDKFGDGFCSYFYYDTLQNAVADANAHTTDNANADESTGKALIAVRQSDDNYIVKPMEDQAIASSIEMSNNMIFDTNNKMIELSAGARFNISGSSVVTFRDSGEGRIFKDNNSGSNEFLFYAGSADSEINILNGDYFIRTNGVVFGLASLGKVNISSSNFYAESLANQQCTAIFPYNQINISNCNIKSVSLGNSYCIYGTSANIKGNIIGGTYEAISKNKKAYCIININNIKNATIKAVYINEDEQSVGETQSVRYINNGDSSSVLIENCSIIADYNSVDYSVDLTSSGVVANSNSSATSFSITNCNIKAVREAVCVKGTGRTLSVKGGVYEGFQHGGFYFCCSKNVIENATIRKWTYDGQFDMSNHETFNANFYIGYSDDACVYMNNCVLDKNYNSVLSSGYEHKDTYLYASNTGFGNIRIDGENSNGNKGHMYIGKGCTYNSTSGSGELDTTTYSSVEFTSEYVQNNFS